jgi:predicted ATP-dependent protease
LNGTTMPPSSAPSLQAAEIDLILEADGFSYETTAELPQLEGIVGQPRAVRALELGLGIRGGGYNVFAVGLSGTNLTRLLHHFVARQVAGQPTPCDWVYVNNFDAPDRPLALALPAGEAVNLRRDLRELPQRLAQILPRALQYHGINQERERLQRSHQQRGQELFLQVQDMARERDFHLEVGDEGQLLILPIRDGQPASLDDLEQLPPEETAELTRQQIEFLRDAQPIFDQQQAISLELQASIQQIERTLSEAILTPPFEELWKRYPQPEVRVWLERVKRHMLDHLAPLCGSGAGAAADDSADPSAPSAPHSPLLEYEVNVVVDNSSLQGPPVLCENVPTYKNLFGFIEHDMGADGRVFTHFTQIKAGSLLRGNGGFVILNLNDALEEPNVWKELKRTLKNRQVQLGAFEPNVPLGASGLQPQAIPLDVKLLVVGSSYLFYALSCNDPDFNDLFKVKAEFVSDMPLNGEGCVSYGRLVRLLSEREGVLPFTAGAVRELVRYGARLAADRRLLSADFSKVAGLVREADYWCRQRRAASVTAEHVRQALEEQVYRSNWFAVQTLRLMQEGSLLIDLAGGVVGRINSLTVVFLGDWAFGRPSRLTATTWVGQTGVINIERESRLSGSTHDKGMLIIEGYLRSKYAQQAPIGLGASVAFEQSYGGVDGDSASAAELFCLVSALAGLPLRQDVGVTGSVNQHGQIQSIGGINEKIEGFFDVCRLVGLTGKQGVCFPRANVPNLVLRPDVREAVAGGRFHVWPIETLDEGLELLTGLPAGDVTVADSVHGRVAARFEQISGAMRERPPTPLERPATIPAATPATPPPTPPPLPPHG